LFDAHKAICYTNIVCKTKFPKKSIVGGWQNGLNYDKIGKKETEILYTNPLYAAFIGL